MTDFNTLDKDHDVPMYSDVCIFCKHETLETPRTCKAFPKGIPMEIWLGKSDHKKPLKGQGNNITFERKE